MTHLIPTVASLLAEFKANYEAALNQKIPPLARGFIPVLTKINAIQIASLYKFGADSIRQALALTATGDDQSRIASNYGVVPKTAQAAIMDLGVTGTSGTPLPSGTEYYSDASRVVYRTVENVVLSAGTTTVSIKANITGTLATLSVTDTLSLVKNITGVDNDGSILAVTTEGRDAETEASLRRRLLVEIRTVGGGSNSVDYQRWAEEPEDVKMAMPYSGKPLLFRIEANTISFSASNNTISTSGSEFIGLNVRVGDMLTIEGAVNSENNRVASVLAISTSSYTVDFTPTDESAGATITLENTSLPGDRTIYIEVGTGTDIPTSDQLLVVRDSILADSGGVARPSLGTTENMLFVEPIYYTTFNIEISNLVVDGSLLIETQAKINAALTTYFESATPHIVGIDFEPDRSDIITDLTASLIIQDVLGSVGASADGIILKRGSTVFNTYTLIAGELARIGTVTYA